MCHCCWNFCHFYVLVTKAELSFFSALDDLINVSRTEGQGSEEDNQQKSGDICDCKTTISDCRVTLPGILDQSHWSDVKVSLNNIGSPEEIKIINFCIMFMDV
jgi:hypothetical protein